MSAGNIYEFSEYELDCSRLVSKLDSDDDLTRILSEQSAADDDMLRTELETTSISLAMLDREIAKYVMLSSLAHEITVCYKSGLVGEDGKMKGTPKNQLPRSMLYNAGIIDGSGNVKGIPKKDLARYI
jgi:hypothetical protein